jgi:hypothetical protein
VQVFGRRLHGRSFFPGILGDDRRRKARIEEPAMRVTDDHIAHYKRHGYAVVERFLAEEEIAEAMAGFHTVFPTWEEFKGGKQRLAREHNIFPWEHRGLNRIATHPELVSAAERIIGSREVKLACSNVLGRYAGDEIHEWFHIDHGGNTLGPILPEDHGNITMALTLNDVQPGMAPTLVVPWGEPDSAAVPMTLPAGSLYIYSTHTTRHTASPFTTPSGLRASLWTIWCHKERVWEGRGWTYKSCPHKAEAFQRYIADATPRQLELIGFPPPGAPLWTRAYIDGMAARYPGFDTAPYLEALGEARVGAA